MRSEDVDARGMTDILAPLKLALAMLEGVQGAWPVFHCEARCMLVHPSNRRRVHPDH